ncbi:BRCA2 and CDKN1A-interacting protein isoform X1 [Pipistrellus kuhlii]|uniref:BRCA2 and CDKN1A-interacting protein n=1 Tax=Pipistrellus kuhlii TaxID=59472 RepID=A0A7J7VA70_PIPKU|nr:BRCA2 and CDKN1A-interacting protein isoform X1 [Pipistrellus kuhlii]KAF6322063.1 BRCA2 and CDKN1A interacting protein [Pipistrellus kuhlii]
MASRPKRRAVGGGTPQPPGAPVPCHEEEENEETEDQDDDDDDDEGDSDEEEDEDEVVGEEVNVEFEAYSISDSDYDGIKRLLQQLFLKAPVNTAELTELLIQQNHIGSVIKQTDVSEDSDDDVDGDEVFGFISLLNLTERKGTPCAEQIKALALRGCAKSCEKSVVEQLDRLLSDSSRPVGLLLSERFVNVPAQIALPLHRQLQKELAEAHKTNKPCGKCHFYLLISKTFAEAGKNNSKKNQSSQKKDELMFTNAEEEFFYEKAALRFSYSVQEESDSCLGGRWSFDDVPMQPLRTVMLVPCDRMGEVMAALEEHLSV